jgi:hypothetical protein
MIIHVAANGQSARQSGHASDPSGTLGGLMVDRRASSASVNFGLNVGLPARVWIAWVNTLK